MHKMLAQRVQFLHYTVQEEIFPFLCFEPFSFISWQKTNNLFLPCSPSPCHSGPPYRPLLWPFPLPCGLPHSSSINERGHCWATQAILSTTIQWSTHVTQGSAVQQICLWLRREWCVLKAWHSTTSCRDTMQAPQSNTTRLALPLARAN